MACNKHKIHIKYSKNGTLKFRTKKSFQHICDGSQSTDCRECWMWKDLHLEVSVPKSLLHNFTPQNEYLPEMTKQQVSDLI